MRISDWSSDVCSSDLTEHFSSMGANGFAAAIGDSWTMIPTELDPPLHTGFRALLNPLFSPPRMRAMEDKVRKAARHHIASFKDTEIGRASCRERVCKDV